MDIKDYIFYNFKYLIYVFKNRFNNYYKFYNIN